MSDSQDLHRQAICECIGTAKRLRRRLSDRIAGAVAERIDPADIMLVDRFVGRLVSRSQFTVTVTAAEQQHPLNPFFVCKTQHIACAKNMSFECSDGIRAVEFRACLPRRMKNIIHGHINRQRFTYILRHDRQIAPPLVMGKSPPRLCRIAHDTDHMHTKQNSPQTDPTEDLPERSAQGLPAQYDFAKPRPTFPKK